MTLVVNKEEQEFKELERVLNTIECKPGFLSGLMNGCAYLKVSTDAASTVGLASILAAGFVSVLTKIPAISYVPELLMAAGLFGSAVSVSLGITGIFAASGRSAALCNQKLENDEDIVSYRSKFNKAAVGFVLNERLSTSISAIQTFAILWGFGQGWSGNDSATAGFWAGAVALGLWATAASVKAVKDADEVNVYEKATKVLIKAGSSNPPPTPA